MSALTDVGEEMEALICGIPNIDDNKRREFREAFIRDTNRKIAHQMRVVAGELEDSDLANRKIPN